jgi:hypothetical protein
MIETSPYVLGLFIWAAFLCSFKCYWQGVICVIVAPYCYNTLSLLTVVVFSAVSLLLGHMLAAVAKHK